MVCHLSEIKLWWISLISATLIILLSVRPVPALIAGAVGTLTIGLLMVYLIFSGYIALRLMAWSSQLDNFGKTIGIVLAATGLFLAAWLVLGRYFYLSGMGAGLFEEQLEVDYFLRRSIFSQLATYAVLGVILIKGAGRADKIISVISALLLVVFALG